jgi:hypothetical protein
MPETRLKTGSTAVDPRGEIEGNHGLGSHYPVYDPVLSYIGLAYSLLTSPAEYTKLSKQVIMQFFHPEELVSARNTLWEECDNDILPKLQKRQNIRQMKGSLLTVGDLIEGIKSLDKADKLPYFAVEFNKLHRIPLSKPCETSSISICERLSKLEARMAANENLCAENNCCIAGKSPARPSTERPISQPATYQHNDANKTREWTTQNQRSLKTQEQTWASVAKNAVHTVNDNEGFTKVESRRRPTRPKRSQRIRGTATDSSAKLSAGPETVMMQITNVSPVVTANELKEYVLAKEGSLSSISIEDNTGEKISKNFEAFCSYFLFQDLLRQLSWIQSSGRLTSSSGNGLSRASRNQSKKLHQFP